MKISLKCVVGFLLFALVTEVSACGARRVRKQSKLFLAKRAVNPSLEGYAKDKLLRLLKDFKVAEEARCRKAEILLLELTKYMSTDCALLVITKCFRLDAAERRSSKATIKAKSRACFQQYGIDYDELEFLVNKGG